MKFFKNKNSNMKKKIINLAIAGLLMTGVLVPMAVKSQDDKETKISNDSRDAKTAFIKTDPSMQALFANSYGYAIFPNIGKGAIGIGGAAGNGTVFEKGNAIGSAKMKQVSVGFQFGGQVYREVIFFETREALDHFKENKVEFTGQVSAVAAKSNASANAKYRDGVLVFTEGKNGLMVEAAVGGQKFSYSAF
jgi:lipid-binding SYLF domain-containing protein